MDNKRLGKARKASKKGSYTVNGTIPKKAKFGRHKIIIKTGKKTYSTRITVIPRPGESPAGGFGRGGILALWVALLGIIGGFVLSSRRRRRPALATGPSGPGVPMVDTSGFTPTMRPHRRPGADPGQVFGSGRGMRRGRIEPPNGDDAPNSP
jgi:hypothetical protein